MYCYGDKNASKSIGKKSYGPKAKRDECGSKLIAEGWWLSDEAWGGKRED